MRLQILKSFTVPDSPLPFTAGELVTVNDALAAEWIADGRAIEFKPFAPPADVPVRRTREKAIRG